MGLQMYNLACKEKKRIVAGKVPGLFKNRVSVNHNPYYQGNPR